MCSWLRQEVRKDRMMKSNIKRQSVDGPVCIGIRVIGDPETLRGPDLEPVRRMSVDSDKIDKICLK